MRGRVEVNYNGQGWGTVCDDGWILENADVVCRMLGYRSASSAPTQAYFGQGLGLVGLDEVLCSGEEGTLLECSYSEIGTHDCRHSEEMLGSYVEVSPSLSLDYFCSSPSLDYYS